MDITNKALIEEIVKRVQVKLEEMEASQSATGTPSASADSKPAVSASSSSSTPSNNEDEVTYNRRLLSEKDIVEHNRAGIKKIVYSKNTIVTDVAKDYAKQYNIELLKQS